MAGMLNSMESIEMDIVVGLGNPLLDITANVDEEFLKKWELTKNQVIVMSTGHEDMYEDLIDNYDIEYSAGGTTQISMRYCQWVVNKNNCVCNFVGCVGNDHFAKIMQTIAKNDGVNTKYMVCSSKSTGTCAILFTNDRKCRSVAACLGASEKIDKSFLFGNCLTSVEEARVVLTSGHVLPASFDCVMSLAKHAHEWGKDFFFNLGGTYVSHKYTSKLMELMPYIDVFFANAEEAISFATVKGYRKKELSEVAKLIAIEPKLRYENPNIASSSKSFRVVVITQCNKSVYLAKSNTNEVKEYPIPAIDEELVKDTNGSGDAFVGGFLAQYICGRSLDLCIKCGIYCSNECIQQIGCAIPKKMTFKI